MLEPVHEAIYRSQPAEHAFRVDPERIEGAIPDDLEGTLLRNGPGLMELGRDHLNFFDGHALIGALSFAGGGATLRTRYVRTPLYEVESQAKAIKTRHVFTNHPSRWKNLFSMKLANNAMHDVYAWGEGEHLRVVAGNDPGHYALDPKTLATKGPERWGGVVPKGCDMGPMPSLDAHTGHLIGFVKKPGLNDAIKFVELDERWKLVRETELFPLSRAGVLVHDQRASERFYVAAAPPFQISLGAALWGSRTLFESFALPPGSTSSLLIAPRDGGALITVPLPRPHQIAFHVINAFDDGAELVVDAVTYEGAIAFPTAAPAKLREQRGLVFAHGPVPTPTRFVIDPAKGSVIQAKRLASVGGECPEIADSHMGKPYRYAYVASGDGCQGLPDRGAYFHYGALAKIDVESGASSVWSAGEGAVVSPPAFCERPGATSEDDGWLVAWVLRESGAGAVVLDAKDLSTGPVATLDLGIHLPGVSHVRWSSSVRVSA